MIKPVVSRSRSKFEIIPKKSIISKIDKVEAKSIPLLKKIVENVAVVDEGVSSSKRRRNEEVIKADLKRKSSASSNDSKNKKMKKSSTFDCSSDDDDDEDDEEENSDDDDDDDDDSDEEVYIKKSSSRKKTSTPSAKIKASSAKSTPKSKLTTPPPPPVSSPSKTAPKTASKPNTPPTLEELLNAPPPRIVADQKQWGRSFIKVSMVVPAAVFGAEYARSANSLWGMKEQTCTVTKFVPGKTLSQHRWEFNWIDPESKTVGTVDFKNLCTYARTAFERESASIARSRPRRKTM
jgi:hypothetical protein